MSVTPHISLRVEPEKLNEWKAVCKFAGTDVSSQIRLLMDAWVQVEVLDAEEKMRLYREAVETYES